MAQTAAPQNKIPLLQQLVGLTPQLDSSTELHDVVFVCIDCEAFEFGPHKITEVGVSVLDTSKIDMINPEITALDLITHIESAHYRIEEYGHLRNKRYVKGNPDAFAFGSSTWIKKADAKTVMLRIFQDATNLSDASKLKESLKGPARNVVLVGHGIKNEVDYLKHLDFELEGAQNVVLRLDTASILSNKKDQVGLKSLLELLEIKVDTSHLHNAGNDAAYTLQALMTIATKEYAEPGCLINIIQAQMAERAARRAARREDEKQKQEAKKKAEEAKKVEEATIVAAGPSDGAVPPPPKNKGFNPKPTTTARNEQKRAERRLKRGEAP